MSVLISRSSPGRIHCHGVVFFGSLHPGTGEFIIPTCHSLPWVPEVFLALFGHERRKGTSFVRPKAEARDITDTGNRARKTSGTQGSKARHAFLPTWGGTRDEPKKGWRVVTVSYKIDKEMSLVWR